MGGKVFGEALGNIGGGMLGGVVDIAFSAIKGEPINGEMVATQLISGGAQGAIAMTGVGAIVMGVDLACR